MSKILKVRVEYNLYTSCIYTFVLGRERKSLTFLEFVENCFLFYFILFVSLCVWRSLPINQHLLLHFMYHSFISSSPSPLHFLRSFYFHRYSFALFLLLFSLVFVILFIFVPSLPSPFGCSTLPRQLSLCRIQHGDCVSAIGSESVT